MLKILMLFIVLVAFAACTYRSAPAPDSDCYDLQIICNGNRETVSVRSHWTETRPPSLEVLCYVKCEGGRACVSTDGCTWLEMK